MKRKIRPVIGPACTEAGKEISNLVFPFAGLDVSWAAVIVGPTHTSDIATATVRISGNEKVCLFMSRTVILHPSGNGW
jgi:hypothetical protein